MHAFVISVIGADVGREEGEKGRNDVSGKAQADERGGDDRPSSEEGPSLRSEAWLQMIVGKKLGEEGHAYHRSKNMKLRTGFVEEALDLTEADQAKASSRVKEGHLWKILPEILYSMPIDIRTSWKKYHGLKQFYWILKYIILGGWVPRCTCVHDCTRYSNSNLPRLVS